MNVQVLPVPTASGSDHRDWVQLIQACANPALVAMATNQAQALARPILDDLAAIDEPAHQLVPLLLVAALAAQLAHDLGDPFAIDLVAVRARQILRDAEIPPYPEGALLHHGRGSHQ